VAFKVVLATMARTDIKEQFDFIVEKEHGKSRAQAWYRDVMSVIKSLRELPARFPRIPESDDIGADVREAFVHSHRIIFEIDPANKIVYVARVYHGSRRPLRPSDL
jgi:plasmid stabilization system protein ParE